MSMPVISPSTTTRDQAITDMLESVALEQTALSHILNAEGEKLQAIVALATTQQQLLDVNQSVNSMVNSISMLEIVLRSKLDLLSNCLTGACCSAITDVNLTQQTPNPAVTITKTNKNNFQITLTDIENSGNIIISTVPTTEAISAVSLGSGVTLNGNIIAWTSIEPIETSSAIIAIGTGSCTQIVTINFTESE